MNTAPDRPETLEAFEDALVQDTILAEAADTDRVDAERILYVCAPSPDDGARPSDYAGLVTVVETPRAQLATDLGAALAKADAA